MEKRRPLVRYAHDIYLPDALIKGRAAPKLNNLHTYKHCKHGDPINFHGAEIRR
jgi:hypothetical protein